MKAIVIALVCAIVSACSSAPIEPAPAWAFGSSWETRDCLERLNLPADYPGRVRCSTR